MKTWVIEPRDSLIARDGRPFGVGAGIRARSLDFPFPSTTTGGVRTRAGLNSDGMFDSSLIDAVKEISIAGPLLVELGVSGEISEWLMPAPVDALIIGTEVEKVQVRTLKPINESPALTNIEGDLLPVGLVTPLTGKPLRGPAFWYWTKFREWLILPRDFVVEPKELGHDGPEKDSRVHASLNEALTTGETGENNLFQTRGLEFRRGLKADGPESVRRLALAVFVDATGRAQNIRSGLAPLGGERRLVAWRDSDIKKTDEIRHCPDQIKTTIISSGHCRLIFLTPAFFEQGFCPEWILHPRQGVTPLLKAIALNRYQVVSGWDFAKVTAKDGKPVIGEPKPTRRLVPSGSVLFLQLNGDEKSIGDWIDDTWFHCVSDDDHEGPMNPRKDGFGLAVLGNWDGILLKME